MELTNTQKIFLDSSPLKNRFETGATKLLFVCSVGMLRSPTAQIAASQLGFNARACGSDVSIALIPLSVNLIRWADKIVFMNPKNYTEAMTEFEAVGYDDDINRKAVVWDINDQYDWGDPWLLRVCSDKLKEMK